MAHPPPQGTQPPAGPPLAGPPLAGPPPTGPPPSGPTPSGPPPARPPLDPVALRRAGRATTRFGLLVLVGVLATGLPLPWGLAALAFTVAALVAGVLALVAAVRARVRATSVVVLSVALALVAGLLLLLLLQLPFYAEVRQAQECDRGAITEQARAVCSDQLRQGVTDRFFGR